MEKVVEALRVGDVVMTLLSRTRNTFRTLATSFDEVEVDLNEGLHQIRQLVAATTSDTGALSCGTGDRMDNKRKYLDDVMQILEMIQNEDEDGYESIAVMEK